MEFYTVIQKTEAMKFTYKWMDKENIPLNEKNQKERERYRMTVVIYGI